MKTFTLEIKTPDKLIFSGEVESIMVEHPSGKEGYLANHEPVLKDLVAGTVQFTTLSSEPDSNANQSALSINKKADSHNTYTIEVTGGFLSFDKNKAILFIR